MTVKFKLLRYSDWWVKLQYKPHLFWKDIWCVSELGIFLEWKRYEWKEKILQWQSLYVIWHTIPKPRSSNDRVCKEFVSYVEDLWNRELEKEERRKRKLKERDIITSEIYS